MLENIPLHPAVVHLPMGLIFILPIVTLLIAALFFRKTLSKHALLIVVLLHAFLVGASYLALETGENEEHQVEKVISESLIENHEERAETFMLATVIVFLFSIGLILPGTALPLKPIAGLVLGGQFVLLALGYRVGHSGGELVYVHGAAQAYVRDQNSSADSADLDQSNKEDEIDDH